MTETHQYQVPGNESTIGHGEQAYPVKQHRVQLPAAAWVTDLETQGLIRWVSDDESSPEVDALTDSKRPDVGPPPEVDTPAEPEIEIPEIFVQAGYASAEAIRSATDEELLAISGVGQATLTQIREALG